jgi:hypothetical protein
LSTRKGPKHEADPFLSAGRFLPLEFLLV